MLPRHMIRWGVVLLVTALPLLFTSCGGSSGRYPVQGAVSYGGEPIDQGSIVFLPVGGEAIKTGGPIKDGRYEIPAEKGPPPGKHKVLLFWEKKTGETYTDRDSGDVYDERKEGLPAEYQSESSPLEIEITAGENVHDFNLTAK